MVFAASASYELELSTGVCCPTFVDRCACMCNVPGHRVCLGRQRMSGLSTIVPECLHAVACLIRRIYPMSCQCRTFGEKEEEITKESTEQRLNSTDVFLHLQHIYTKR